MSNFNPDTTSADAEMIRERAEDLYAFVGRILGRAGDMKAAIDSSAAEFSDLIAESISSEASYNRTAWQDASFLAAYAGGVTEAWADDVDWYTGRIDALETRWDDARENHFGVAAPAGGPSNSAEGQVFDQRRNQARSQLLGTLETQAESAREEFERRAKKRASQLSEGPTEESVRELVRTAGVLAWAPNNLGWTDPPLPVTAADGVSMAEDLVPYLNGEKPLDEEYAAIVAALNAVSHKGWRRQTFEDGELPPEEIAFLRAFYATLDSTPVNAHTPPPFLDMVRRISTDDYYGPDGFEGSESSGRELLGALGDGLLILSDENLGGGWDDLPTSVRGVLSGERTFEYDGDEYTSHATWDEHVAPLVEMFEHVHPGIQGGTEFSGNVIITVGGAASPNAHGTPDTGLMADGEAGAQTLLGVANRNIEANHAVLTGEHESPHDVDAQTALRNLYSFDWSDDGEALNGLTNWIRFEDSRTLPDQREMAAEAMAGLITSLTDGESGTFDDLAGNQEIDGRQTNLGMLNPAVSRHLVELSEIYMDSFAAPIQGGPTTTEDDELRINTVDRVRFWTLAAGDPLAGHDLNAAIERHQSQRLADLVEGEAEVAVVGAETGMLRGIYDRAILSEAGARENYAAEDAATAQAEGRRAVPLVSGSIKEILNNVVVKDPRVKAIVGIGNEVARYSRDWIWSGTPDEEANDFSIRVPITTSKSDIELGTLLSLADAAVVDGQLDAGDLPYYTETAEAASEYDQLAGDDDADAVQAAEDRISRLEPELRAELRAALGEEGLGVFDMQLVDDQHSGWDGIVGDPEGHDAQRFAETVLQGKLKRNEPDTGT